jgi:chloride channel protein, CIC family
MLMGGAIGSLLARALRSGEREQRLLLVAGMAAGMAAVFHTPLGAALLAVEVLHRDDFESDALIPAVLASVIGYSVSVSMFGHSTLFSHAASYPFVPAHLPLYGLLACAVSATAVLFVKLLDGVKRFTKTMPVPPWARPAVGGLALSAIVTPTLIIASPYLGRSGQGVGLLGGGYGAAQVAISGAEWLPKGWTGVELLFAFAAVKMLASALTVGTGGSAGDFGPSLVIGGLVGGGFGRAAGLLLDDPRIDAGAFALVGMGTFYGGIAHVPLAALVMVCELAGSYDLLVPLMLCEGIAFVLLRDHTIYKNQIATKRQSPAHRKDLILDVLREIRVNEILEHRDFVSFTAETPALEMVRRVASSEWQDAFPILAGDGQLVGIVQADPLLRAHAAGTLDEQGSTAGHLMSAPFSVRLSDDLHVALDAILAHHTRELPVVSDEGKIEGLLDEAEITKVYQGVTEGTNAEG